MGDMERKGKRGEKNGSTLRRARGDGGERQSRDKKDGERQGKGRMKERRKGGWKGREQIEEKWRERERGRGKRVRIEKRL